MTVSKAQMAATKRFEDKAYDKTLIRMPKGYLPTVKDHAAQRGETLNGFINRAITETVERDNGGIPAPAKEKQAGPSAPAHPMEQSVPDQSVHRKPIDTISDDEFRERVKALREQHKADGEADGGEQETKEEQE